MLNGLMISMFCANVALFPGNSCGPTSEAISKQVGFYQDVDKAEGQAKAVIYKNTPKTLETIVAYSGTAYKLAIGDEVKMGFKVPDLCDRVEVGASRSGQTMSLTWSF
jgi:hypothetical protein